MLILIVVNIFSIGIDYSYITRLEGVASFPAEIIAFKPNIEYGKKLGVSACDIYISLDCYDPDTVEIGANCIQVGPFYRWFIGRFNLMLGLGILRIDLAGMGSYEGVREFAGIIDEDRTGVYANLAPKFMSSERTHISAALNLGIIKDGSFLDYGVSLAFMPFKNKGLFLTVGLSGMQLRVEAEGMNYSFPLGMYWVGIGYEQTADHRL